MVFGARLSFLCFWIDLGCSPFEKPEGCF
uniref:Uncharacterized protein n=1 Tax=Vitis vinifera TaxID=29760 RepID=F6HZV6_VITVI